MDLLRLWISPSTARLHQSWLDRWAETYFRERYGSSWLWYYNNYQTNHEILL